MALFPASAVRFLENGLPMWEKFYGTMLVAKEGPLADEAERDPKSFTLLSKVGKPDELIRSVSERKASALLVVDAHDQVHLFHQLFTARDSSGELLIGLNGLRSTSTLHALDPDELTTKLVSGTRKGKKLKIPTIEEFASCDSDENFHDLEGSGAHAEVALRKWTNHLWVHPEAFSWLDLESPREASEVAYNLIHELKGTASDEGTTEAEREEIHLRNVNKVSDILTFLWTACRGLSGRVIVEEVPGEVNVEEEATTIMALPHLWADELRRREAQSPGEGGGETIDPGQTEEGEDPEGQRDEWEEKKDDDPSPDG